MRSGSDQCPSLQLILPEPLSLTYPLAHSTVTSEPSVKEFNRSASLVKTIFSSPSGLGQLAGDKKKEEKRQHQQLFIFLVSKSGMQKKHFKLQKPDEKFMRNKHINKATYQT